MGKIKTRCLLANEILLATWFIKQLSPLDLNKSGTFCPLFPCTPNSMTAFNSLSSCKRFSFTNLVNPLPICLAAIQFLFAKLFSFCNLFKIEIFWRLGNLEYWIYQFFKIFKIFFLSTFLVTFIFWYCKSSRISSFA